VSSGVRDPVSVLVTGVGGGSHGNEVIKALRLADTPYHIIGVDMSPTSLGLYQTDASYIVPPARHSEYIEVLLELCRGKGVQVLIPGSEPELKVVSAHRQCFADAEILILINDPGVIDLCMDKWSTMRFLAENGFNVPQSVLLEREDDCAKVERLPVVVKPAVDGGGSNLAFIAQDHEELSFFARYILKAGGRPMAQEYLATPDDEYSVGVLTTLAGELVGSLAVRRYILSGLSNKMKIQGRTSGYTGHTLALSSGISQGVIEDYPEVRGECERLAKILGSKGPLNVQLRVVDGKVYTFEINPRFSGTTAFRALAGYNEPDIMIRHHLLGEMVGPVSYTYGVVMRGLVERFIRPEEMLQHSQT
jgi:carbamoyl-phosphate synthase large subunit